MKKHILLLLIITFFGLSHTQAQNDFDFEIAKNLDIYADLFQKLNTYYVDEIEPGKLNHKAIDALLKTLDPYTVYYPESEITDVRFMQSGEYGGIGTEIGIKDGNVIITNVFENSPAEKAGIEIGDIILKVDDQIISAINFDQVSYMMRGAVDSKVKFLISKPVSLENKEVELIRKKIKIDNVSFYKTFNDSIAYVKLEAFKMKSAAEIKTAIENLKEEEDISSLILDLRSNPGGLLQEAIYIMDLFVGSNEKIVETKGKLQAQNNIYKTRFKPTYPDMKVVVLINGRSASASEIVAGSFQDLDRGVVIGEKSFGKGLVQKVVPLTYNAQAKITVSKYYIPSGRCIQALDYHNTGRGEKIADSLARTFYTAAGRPVKDAGGIIPDIKIEKFTNSELINKLISSYSIFDFATNYVANTKNYSEEKLMNDEDLFEDFIDFLRQENFIETTEEYDLLEELKEKIESENSKKQIEDLEKALIEDYILKLKKDKKEVEKLIRLEIISRYSKSTGKIKAALDGDEYVKKAIEILSDNSKYQSILTKP